MPGFNLPPPEAPQFIFGISEATRAEAWATSIEQAKTAEQCLALQLRLYHRLDLLREREMPCEVERAALLLCARRAVELIGEHIAGNETRIVEAEERIPSSGLVDRLHGRRPFAGIDFGT